MLCGAFKSVFFITHGHSLTNHCDARLEVVWRNQLYDLHVYPASVCLGLSPRDSFSLFMCAVALGGRLISVSVLFSFQSFVVCAEWCEEWSEYVRKRVSSRQVRRRRREQQTAKRSEQRKMGKQMNKRNSRGQHTKGRKKERKEKKSIPSVTFHTHNPHSFSVYWTLYQCVCLKVLSGVPVICFILSTAHWFCSALVESDCSSIIASDFVYLSILCCCVRCFCWLCVECCGVWRWSERSEGILHAST